VALLPASRKSEVCTLAPRLRKAAEILRRKESTDFVAAVSASLEQAARQLLPPWIRILVNRTTEVLLSSDVAAVKTGPATLEAAVAGTPQVAIYAVSFLKKLEWCLLWAWKGIRYFAMPDIILQRNAVPELISLASRPDRIARAVMSLLEDLHLRNRMSRD
jgi:lipid-A-disaccharide synthase